MYNFRTGQTKGKFGPFMGRHYAADDLQGLGSFSSFIKKAVKTAAKLSPSHILLKKIAPKAAAKLQKIETMGAGGGSGSSKPTLTSAQAPAVVDPNSVATTPTSVLVPDALTPAPVPQMFSTGSGGGASPSFMSPADATAAAAPETDNTLLYVGIAAAAFAGFLLLRKRR